MASWEAMTSESKVPGTVWRTMIERDEGDEGGEQLGGGAGEGGEHLVARRIAEVARGEGDGLAPAEDERAAEDEEDGPDEHAEEVEVAGRVHGEATHHACGGVAEAVGGPGLGAVVQGDGEHHHDQLKDDQGVRQRHEDSLREYFLHFLGRVAEV